MDWGAAADVYVRTSTDRVAVLELAASEDVVIRAVNPALARLLGVRPEEVTDQPGARFYPAEELADVVAKVRATLTSGEMLAYEAVRELPQGRLVVSGRMVPLDARRVLAVGTDVSAEHQARRRLEQLEELADIGVWSWNVVDDVATWSTHYRRIYGIPLDAPASHETGLELVHPDDRSSVAALADDIRGGGRTRPLRYRIVRPDGELRWIEGRAEAVRDAAGRLVRLVGTVQDVTEQHELQERDRRYREAERRQAQALELNDDIVQELSRAWLALDLGDVDEARDVIERTTRRMQAIVSGLLTPTGTDGAVSPGDLVRDRPAGEPRT